jgi:hypothetical protein
MKIEDREGQPSGEQVTLKKSKAGEPSKPLRSSRIVGPRSRLPGMPIGVIE